MDAFSHNVPSNNGNYYADTLTDSASRRRHVVFTKDRRASSLVAALRVLFLKKPHWSVRTSTLKTIRLDSEGAYTSDAFLQFVSEHGFTLEFTPPRDKHANGIAERAVGVVVAKANEAMLGSTVPCPKNLWTYAMTYAVQTLNFNPNKHVNTSSYNYETGLHTDMNHMRTFFSEGYLFTQKEKRLSKLGCPRAQLCHFLTYHFTTAFQPNYVVLPVLGPGKYGQIIVSKDVIFDDSIPDLTNN